MKSTAVQKKRLFCIQYAIVDYQKATDLIIENARHRQSYGVTALAVHGLIESVWDEGLARSVNAIDLVVADGQPIRWALNSFYHVGLKDRVYGPTLTTHVLEKADAYGLKVFLYGSTRHTLDKLTAFIRDKYPGVVVCGVHTDRFREATPGEDLEDIQKIEGSGAHIVLVGRGCPRQEKWVAAHLGKVNAAMMAVGAAFDFHAGTQKQAPSWMQKHGLEWLFRLIQEPGRLWKRYLVTNSTFVYLFLKEKFFAKKHNINQA